MTQTKPPGAEKRKAYMIWFFIAAGVDVGWSVFDGTAYRPSLVGLAIMITAVIFFIYSWFTER